MIVGCLNCNEVAEIPDGSEEWKCKVCWRTWKITHFPNQPHVQSLVSDRLQVLAAAISAMERMEAVEQVLAHMFGAEPEALILRQGDAFSITTDFRPLCRAVGGKWAELVDRVEADEKERKANVLASAVTRDEINEKWIKTGMPSLPAST